ncbi:MAG: hypothetical protein H8E00_00870 [Deltaproteobacteria bacterium]|nr:hypothetical protein [Deltaproteobacteria bacterium]
MASIFPAVISSKRGYAKVSDYAVFVVVIDIQAPEFLLRTILRKGKDFAFYLDAFSEVSQEADCYAGGLDIIDAGFREFRLLPKRQGVSLWKSPIDILPVKKADQFNAVLCHFYSEPIISKLDTIILLITLDFLDPPLRRRVIQLP